LVGGRLRVLELGGGRLCGRPCRLRLGDEALEALPRPLGVALGALAVALGVAGAFARGGEGVAERAAALRRLLALLCRLLVAGGLFLPVPPVRDLAPRRARGRGVVSVGLCCLGTSA